MGSKESMINPLTTLLPERESFGFAFYTFRITIVLPISTDLVEILLLLSNQDLRERTQDCPHIRKVSFIGSGCDIQDFEIGVLLMKNCRTLVKGCFSGKKSDVQKRLF